jgi:hypothetical protein
MSGAELPEQAEGQLAQLGSRDLAIALLTYNNTATVGRVLQAAVSGVQRHLPDVSTVMIAADAGSSDDTTARIAGAGVPTIVVHHDAPLTERARVPFHGVPGRGGGLQLVFRAAQRLGVRALVVVEADVTSITDEWVPRLARPLLEDKADLVAAAFARHRYDGTITNLILAPLIRALYGRRLRQPLAGSQALSARLIEHLLRHPRWNWAGRDVADLWIVGTAIADGFSVWEAWLGRRRVESRTRTTDLPDMMAQTLGAVFTVMDRHESLWREARGSEPLPAVGEPTPLATDAVMVDVEHMIAAFRQGLRDLVPIWEHVLAPETLDAVLELDPPDIARFRFPDDLWARVVYDFALGHHYGVVHRDHLLRSLVPLYLGRTGAFVLATQRRDAAATEAVLDAVGTAFERAKPYLVERWR